MRAARGTHAAALLLAALLPLAGCGRRPAAPGSAGTPSASPGSAAASQAAAFAAPAAVAVTDLGPLLPRGLVGTAAASLGGRIYLFGGSGSGGYFNGEIYAFDPSAPGVAAVGRLPQALHDGGAAPDAGSVLFCGGGQSVGESAIYRFTPGAAAAQPAGRMPRALSDLAGVSLGGEPYCLGGWTGQLYSDAVYDLGGGQVRLAAHLPHAVRYGAAAALSGGILVAGGMLTGGNPTADIQWVPLPAAPGAQPPAVVGRLAQPLAYAMAAALGPAALVIGGCGASGAPVDTILAVGPSGQARSVGSLPQPLCYGSAAAVGSDLYVFGGQGPDGAPSAHVWKIAPTR